MPEDAALEHNYLLVTFNSDSQIDRERNLFHVLSRYRMDGILLVIASEDDLKHVHRAVDDGTPIVFLDRFRRDLSAIPSRSIISMERGSVSSTSSGWGIAA